MRTRALSLSLLAVTALTTVAACDKDGIPVDEFPARFEQKVCDLNTSCGVVPDRATCEESTVFADNGGAQSTIAAVKRGTIKYDGELAQECLDRLGAGCISSLDVPDACARMFTGTVATGGACYLSDECANQASCERPGCTTSCCAGTCGVARVPVGGDCTISGAVCQRDSFCNNAGICSAKLPLGAACDDSFYCADPNACAGGVCVARAATGETCNATITDACLRIDEHCDATTLKCVKRKAPGAACPSGDDDECAEYARCENGACTARPSLGDACDNAASIYCLGNLACVAGVCAAPTAEPICP